MWVVFVLLGLISAREFSDPPLFLRTEQQPAGSRVLGSSPNPRLSWVNPLPNDEAQNVTQIKYSVEVYNGTVVQPSSLVWASGAVNSNEQMTTVRSSLSSESVYCWRVRVVLSTSSEFSPWSDVLPFRTALQSSTWRSRNVSWVGGFNQLRRAMTIPQGEIQEAVVAVTGVGAYYVFVNGERVGDHIMSPAQTVYPRRMLYEVFDVTKLLRPAGPNVIGAMLGNVKWGYDDLWCNMTVAKGPKGCQALLLQLTVTFKDGRKWSVVTNEQWEGREGPVLWDHLFHGETFDARLIEPEWATNPAAGVWSPVVQITPPGTGLASFDNLFPSMLPPIRVTRDYSPARIFQQSTGESGSWIFDFGQNMAGFVTLKLKAGQVKQAGAAIKIEHAEILFADETLQNTYCKANPNLKDLRHEPCFPHQTYGNGHDIADRYIGDFNNANMTNIYISNGTVVDEEYTPLFSYAGFRFVRVSGLPFTPDQSTLTAHFAHTDVQPVGNFSVAPVSAAGAGTFGTANVLNRIHSLVQFSQLSNLWSIPTDCPQRERRGWTGDSQVSSGEALLNFDMQTFYEKFLNDMRDDQLWGCASTPGSPCSDPIAGKGSIADVVPFDGIGGWPGCPVWQVAYIVIARQYWKYYGDISLLQTHYPGLVDLMDHFIRVADPSDGLLTTSCYGDWVDTGFPWGQVPPTPPSAVTSFYFVLGLQYMMEIATALNLPAEMAKYSQLHAKGLAAYHHRYFDAATSSYSPNENAPLGSQCSNAMALELGAPPSPDIAAKVGEMLRADVEKQSNHSTGGIVGMVWTFPALAHAGHGGHALAILRQDTFPSFGRMLQQNFTTLCESWKCTVNNDGGGSMNHIMFGGFDWWMMTALGGLDTVSNASTTAWRVMRVAPLAEALTELKTGGMSVNTRFGVAAVSWRFDSSNNNNNNNLSLNVTVPVGSTAEVHIPERLVGGLKLLLPITVNRVVEQLGRVVDNRERLVDLPSGRFLVEASYK